MRFNIALTLDCMRISNVVAHTLTKAWTYRVIAFLIKELQSPSYKRS